MPKLKTHEEVGITCAIKGCVGSVGHKDCLAHHRFGAPPDGADEYPCGLTGVRRMASHLHDFIQRHSIENSVGRNLRIFDRIVKRIIRSWMIAGGAWWGDDTCWRMAVDRARILSYARFLWLDAGSTNEAALSVD